MSIPQVTIHELIAWDLDEYSFRDAVMASGKEKFAARLAAAQRRLAVRREYKACNAMLDIETEVGEDFFVTEMERADLRQEYAGLDWTLGVVDLRCLLAFQRRLVFDPGLSALVVPQKDDWRQLVSLALGSRRSTVCDVKVTRNDGGALDVRLRSLNPDLQVRLAEDEGRDGSSLFSIHGGSPFIEVAEFSGRWILRDGYHRAYGLLQAGISSVPAVIIRAKTIAAVGATEPWFFGEELLLSDRPPRVVDFLEESMILRYQRPQLMKTIRIRVEEALEVAEAAEEVQGE